MDQRIEDLEVRIAYLEKNITDLDGVIQELGQGLGSMARQIEELRESFSDALGEVSRAEGKEDVPPHY
jgi:uncharacterized coiled-coil protein SlyX